MCKIVNKAVCDFKNFKFLKLDALKIANIEFILTSSEIKKVFINRL